MSSAAPPFDLTTSGGARALLEALVRRPSPSGAEGAVARCLVAALAPYADAAYVDEVGNAVAVVGDGARRVTMLAHLDTFPGRPPVRVVDDVLYGRGAVDAKGSAVALAVALARAPSAVRTACTLRFVGAVEEESPTSRGARHAVLAYPRPDRLIVGEPSGWDHFTLGYKGRLRQRLRVERAATHGARLEATAAERMVDAWLRLRLWADAATPAVEGGGVFERLQIALTEVASGHDGLTAWAEATADWRLPPAWPPARLVAGLAGVDLGSDVTWSADGAERAVRGDRDGDLARAFRSAVRRMGGRPVPKIKTGTSDWNVVAPYWGVDTVAYGPGDAAMDHTPGERLPLEDLDRAIEVLSLVLVRLATGAPRREGTVGRPWTTAGSGGALQRPDSS